MATSEEWRRTEGSPTIGAGRERSSGGVQTVFKEYVCVSFVCVICCTPLPCAGVVTFKVWLQAIHTPSSTLKYTIFSSCCLQSIQYCEWDVAVTLFYRPSVRTFVEASSRTHSSLSYWPGLPSPVLSTSRTLFCGFQSSYDLSLEIRFARNVDLSASPKGRTPRNHDEFCLKRTSDIFSGSDMIMRGARLFFDPSAVFWSSHFCHVNPRLPNVFLIGFHHRYMCTNCNEANGGTKQGDPDYKKYYFNA